MQVQEFKLQIPKSREKDFVSVPFQLDADTERLEVSYQYDNRSTIDLALYRNEKMWGWSGGERDQFFITRYCATPGYQPGLPAGDWAVVLGTYEINADVEEVTVTVRQHKKQLRWLKGDLHSHTENSDGGFKIPEAIELCRAKGLDFLCTTDHNTAVQNQLKPSMEDDFVLIPGFELTTYRGHCNFLGVKNAVSDFRVVDRDDLDRCMAEGIENNAVIGINHPFIHCGWHWGWNVPYHYVEIWNGPWGHRNQLALDWWHGQLCEGRRIAVAAGSDVHKKNKETSHGCACTHVYADEKTPEAILAAVVAGRAFITADPDSPELIVSAGGEMLMGSSAPQGRTIRLEIKNLKPGDRIKTINATGVVEEVTAESKLFAGEVTMAEQFVRFEIWRDVQGEGTFTPVTISNPVYID